MKVVPFFADRWYQSTTALKDCYAKCLKVRLFATESPTQLSDIQTIRLMLMSNHPLPMRHKPNNFIIHNTFQIEGENS